MILPLLLRHAVSRFQQNTRTKYPVNSIPGIFVAVDEADAELLDNTRKGLGPRLNSAPKEQKGKRKVKAPIVEKFRSESVA